MAQPPEFRRFSKEDLDTSKADWIDRLIVPLNTFLEQTYTLFNGNLTLGDNVNGLIVDATFTTSSTYNTGDFPNVLLPWGKNITARGVLVGNIRNVTTPTAVILNAVTPQWTQNDISNIKITYLSGLANSTKYAVRFIVL